LERAKAEAEAKAAAEAEGAAETEEAAEGEEAAAEVATAEEAAAEEATAEAATAEEATAAVAAVADSGAESAGVGAEISQAFESQDQDAFIDALAKPVPCGKCGVEFVARQGFDGDLSQCTITCPGCGNNVLSLQRA
jgi:hypothetical protein